MSERPVQRGCLSVNVNSLADTSLPNAHSAAGGGGGASEGPGVAVPGDTQVLSMRQAR